MSYLGYHVPPVSSHNSFCIEQMQSQAHSILASLLPISFSVFIPWTTFKNKTSEQQHPEVIRNEVVISTLALHPIIDFQTFEPSQQTHHPLSFYHYCSELCSNMSSYSNKDQWNEVSRHILTRAHRFIAVPRSVSN